MHKKDRPPRLRALESSAESCESSDDDRGVLQAFAYTQLKNWGLDVYVCEESYSSSSASIISGAAKS